MALVPSALGQCPCVVLGATVLGQLTQPECANTETAKGMMQLGTSAAGPTLSVAGMRPVSGAFGWTPTFHPLWGHLAAGTLPTPPALASPQSLAWQGRRKDSCFRLVSITPCLALTLGTVGGLGSGAAGTGALVLHPQLISVTDGMSPVTTSLPETALLLCPAHAHRCQLRGPATLARPSLATRALGSRQRPWAGSCAPAEGHAAGQRGISQGISHAGTSCFSPLPPTTSLLPEPLTPALAACFPHHGASLPLCHHSAVSPSFFPMPWHSLLSIWPCTGATCTGFLLLGHWWYWERCCCTPGWLLNLGVGWP